MERVSVFVLLLGSLLAVSRTCFTSLITKFSVRFVSVCVCACACVFVYVYLYVCVGSKLNERHWC